MKNLIVHCENTHTHTHTHTFPNQIDMKINKSNVLSGSKMI